MVKTEATARAFPGFGNIKEDVIAAVDETYDLGSIDKKWAAIWVAIAMVTSLTIGGVIGLSNVDSWLFINASTIVNGSLNVTENITAINITADYYFGNGSQLTGITAIETDPYWSGNQSSYFNTTDILGFSYYNATDFDIADYFTSAEVLGFNYYNSTDFDIADYLNLSTLLSFGYYNSTDFSISDYFTKSDILGFSYYNSTDFSIADYSTTASIIGWNYWNDTYATFNKTYADTLYLTAESDPKWSANYTAYNSSWSSTYNVTYDAKVSFPGWDANLAWENQTNIFTANQNLTAVNVSAINCIIFDSGGKICSGT